SALARRRPEHADRAVRGVVPHDRAGLNRGFAGARPGPDDTGSGAAAGARGRRRGGGRLGGSGPAPGEVRPPPALGARGRGRGGAVPPPRVWPARTVRGGRGDRGLGAPVRARARAGVRACRAARRRGGRVALRVAAVGLGDVDRPGGDPRARERPGGAPMRRAAGLLLTLAMLAGVSCTSSSPDPIRIGAVYPLSGAQGPGGAHELDGGRLAVQLVNTDGGVGGRPVELVPVDTPSADAAPGA